MSKTLPDKTQPIVKSGTAKPKKSGLAGVTTESEKALGRNLARAKYITGGK